MKISRVHIKGPRYYYIEDLAERSPTTGRPKQKWHKLTRIDEGEAALLEALKQFHAAPAAPRAGSMAAHVQAFTRAHFSTLTVDVRREYARMFTVISQAFEEFDTDQVLPGDVLSFLNTNFAGNPTTRRAYKARLSTFFSWCVLQGHITVNPCREIKLKAPPKRKSKLTDEKFWLIHRHLAPMGQVFLELLYLTRQRPTEIRLLRESQIGHEYIHFTPSKTEHTSGEEVEILITPEIRAALDRARALRPARKVEQLARRRDPYIIQTRDGSHYTKTGLYEVWRDAVVPAGLRGITTRDVRPYALSKMEAAGYSLREIQLAAAHSDVSTTEGYINQHRPRVSDAVISLPERK